MIKFMNIYRDPKNDGAEDWLAVRMANISNLVLRDGADVGHWYVRMALHEAGKSFQIRYFNFESNAIDGAFLSIKGSKFKFGISTCFIF